MKIKIKKKYIGIISSFVTLLLAYFFIQEVLIWLSYKNLSVLILPMAFLVSLIYTVNYWMNLKEKEKLADEVSKEVAGGDPTKILRVKEHLWQRCKEEAYTLNLLKGKVKFTSTWSEQDQVEKNKND